MNTRSKNYTGKKFQMLTLLEKTTKGGMHAYVCLCDCGNTNTVRWNAIQQGQLSCGCKSQVDYTGRRFGRLSVLEKRGTGKGHKYRCQCVCGKELEVTYNNLHTGNTKSCGCVRSEACVHREAVRRQGRPRSDIVRNAVWRYYKRNAKTRELSWELTKERFYQLIDAPCFYCARVGVTLSKCGADTLRVNGVDRADNSLGYSEENCVTCCITCNRAKSSLSLDEFDAWATAFLDHQMRQRKH